VNNAAIENEDVPLHELDDANLDRIIAINLRGVFLCMKHDLRHLLAQGDWARSSTSPPPTRSARGRTRRRTRRLSTAHSGSPAKRRWTTPRTASASTPSAHG
jgi:NAD(P)-dependent dehydrogenase (short-subunit alcohol dehydrogenase family)